MVTPGHSTNRIPKNDLKNTSSIKQQSFLILQGPPSRFAQDLGDELSLLGYNVKRVNFSIGDWLFWHDSKALNFRGRLSEWSEYLRHLVVTEGISDIVYYADRPPYHSVAAHVADQCGIRAISYEFGYLRPDWIIVEHRGHSTYSHFPNDLAQIKSLAEGLPAPDMKLKYVTRFIDEATREVIYNLSNYFFWFLFSNFVRDKYYDSLMEYLSYIPRLILRKIRNASANEFVENIIEAKNKYFLVPLQMQNDYQVRANSPYKSCRTFIEQTIRSFAEHAENDANLIFKVHPLDCGLERWGAFIRKQSNQVGLGDRVQFLDGGNLHKLLTNTLGVVTINSTTGLHALQAGAPVKVQGIAVYDIPGLTHQGSLDDFWRHPQPPDRPGVRALVRLMAASIHVKGDFFSEPGRKAAVKGFVERLTTGQINARSAFVDPPPRLERARAMGIQIDAPDQTSYETSDPAKQKI